MMYMDYVHLYWKHKHAKLHFFLFPFSWILKTLKIPMISSSIMKPFIFSPPHQLFKKKKKNTHQSTTISISGSKPSYIFLSYFFPVNSIVLLLIDVKATYLPLALFKDKSNFLQVWFSSWRPKLFLIVRDWERYNAACLIFKISQIGIILV